MEDERPGAFCTFRGGSRTLFYRVQLAQSGLETEKEVGARKTGLRCEGASELTTVTARQDRIGGFGELSLRKALATTMSFASCSQATQHLPRLFRPSRQRGSAETRKQHEGNGACKAAKIKVASSGQGRAPGSFQAPQSGQPKGTGKAAGTGAPTVEELRSC